MTRFQACIGPSGNKLHIVDIYNRPLSLLVLCEATAPVRNYKGAAKIENICKRCLKKVHELETAAGRGDEALTADLIGVREIL